MVGTIYRKPEAPEIRGTCVACGERPQSSKGGGKYRPTCRSCHTGRFGISERRKTPAERRLARYGISPEEYEARLADQDGRCAICTEVTAPPDVDHCHATGRVRGLLCRRCNLALGKFKDDPAIIERALDYLLRGG